MVPFIMAFQLTWPWRVRKRCRSTKPLYPPLDLPNIPLMALHLLPSLSTLSACVTIAVPVLSTSSDAFASPLASAPLICVGGLSGSSALPSVDKSNLRCGTEGRYEGGTGIQSTLMEWSRLSFWPLNQSSKRRSAGPMMTRMEYSMRK